MELDKDEIICPDCNGLGVLDDYIFKSGRRYNLVCYKCQGDGTLDWIENVIGKKSAKRVINSLKKVGCTQPHPILGARYVKDL